MGRTWAHIFALAGLLAGCDPAGEYRAALPNEDTVTTSIPDDGSTASGLASSRSALVGAKSDFYAETYYASRDLNLLGRAVVELVEGISKLPATTVDETHAVWGPFSDSGEPNEFMMTVEKIDARYDWRIEGKHKADDQFLLLAGGTFEPKSGDLGRGWFELDFDAVASLDPTEDAQGRVAYAFEKTSEETSVRVRYQGPEGEAGYAFGKDAKGGFILFAFPGDIEENSSANEDVLIRTRWTKAGAGRADVVARNGDLGEKIATAAQCWDDRFVSRFEMLAIEGTAEIEVGDEGSCVFEAAMVPTDAELPKETDVQNPFE